MKTLLLLSCLLTGIASAPALGQDSPDALARLVEQFRENAAVPGASVAIARGDRLIYSAGHGFADLEHQVPATAQTRYRTASIAKSMTAVAVMQLVEAGKLELDADIRGAAPAFPEKRWPINARLLLCHQSGVRHYLSGGEATGSDHFFDLASTLPLFADSPLRHEPGTKMTYTTFGYTLLGLAVEHASGQRFDDYLQQHIFEPAGMSRTCPDDHYAVVPQRTGFYQRLSPQAVAQLPEAIRGRVPADRIVHADFHDTSMKVPGGGLLSTAEDLVRFGNAVRDAQLVSAETRDAMWTAQPTRAGEDTGYGLGFGVRSPGGVRQISHSGGQAGTATLLTLLPDQQLTLAVMCNLQGAPVRDLVRQLVAQLIE